MKIVVVGAGALGSHLVLLIRNLKADFRVVDFDLIEAKNVMAQFHTKMALRKNKANALKESMNGLFGLKLDAIPHRLTVDNVTQLLGDADLVVDCLDNAASRQVIQDFVRARKIPCLHGALDPDGQFGRVCWDEGFAIDHEGAAGAATCEDGRHLPFIALTSSCLATAVQRFVEKGQRVAYQVHPGGAVRV